MTQQQIPLTEMIELFSNNHPDGREIVSIFYTLIKHNTLLI